MVTDAVLMTSRNVGVGVLILRNEDSESDCTCGLGRNWDWDWNRFLNQDWDLGPPTGPQNASFAEKSLENPNSCGVKVSLSSHSGNFFSWKEKIKKFEGDFRHVLGVLEFS